MASWDCEFQCEYVTQLETLVFDVPTFPKDEEDDDCKLVNLSMLTNLTALKVTVHGKDKMYVSLLSFNAFFIERALALKQIAPLTKLRFLDLFLQPNDEAQILHDFESLKQLQQLHTLRLPLVSKRIMK